MRRALKVREISQYISNLLTQDRLLRQIDVEGEIVNLRKGRYIYFDLRDEQALLHCVVFQPMAMDFQEGDKVVASGRINVYLKGGSYQLIVNRIQAAGLGEKLLALHRLREKLLKEGLFDPSRKKTFPAYPRRIGLVTSMQGAVLHDFANECNRRYPLLTIVVAHAAVQGDQAAETIIAALKYLVNLQGDQALDAIVIARGGGSREDLDCFNNESLVRAVAASPVPILSAIGHQVDSSLTDLAADQRASTPTEAAILLLPDRLALHQEVDENMNRIRSSCLFQLHAAGNRLNQLERSLAGVSPLARLYQNRSQLDRWMEGISSSLLARLQSGRRQVDQQSFFIQTDMNQRLFSSRKKLDTLLQSIRQRYEEKSQALTWRVFDEQGELVGDESSLQLNAKYQLESASYRYGVKVLSKESKDGSRDEF